MKKHPLIWFYILAFGISWLGWMPVVLGSHGIAPFDSPFFQVLLLLPAVGPALAAWIVTATTGGKPAVQNLFGKLLRWRVSPAWYLAALCGPAVLLFTGQSLTRWLGLSAAGAAPQGSRLAAAIPALILALLSNPWEEVGWRGFALPRLQMRQSALLASLVIGALWGLWHLPLFFWAGNPMAEYPFLPWFISTIAQAIVYTWLYNSASESLLIPALFHVAFNTTGALIPGVSVAALALVTCLAALLLVAGFGAQRLARSKPGPAR